MTLCSTKSSFLLAAAICVAGAGVVPAMAQSLPPAQAERLNAATSAYSYYRGRGWRGNRGAVIAGAVGLGVLGAAIAASRPAYGYGYGEPVYVEPEPYGYGYGYAPAYAAPVYVPPVQAYPRRRGPYADTYRGAPDPARGGR
jgi:hypothetical protein